MNCIRRFSVSLILLTATSLTLAADWPQWRGPARDNLSQEKGLLDRWPDGGPPLVWTAKGLGAGYSGISVANGRIYTMGEDKSSSYIRALDEESGKIVWSTKIGAVGGGGGYAGPRATPTVDGERVYAVGQYGDLVCAEAKDGKEVWRTNLDTDLHGKMMSHWGYAESVLIDGEKLICTPGGEDGTLAALDKSSGKVLWRSKDFTDRAAYASVIAVNIDDTPTYIVLTGDSVAGISAADGKLLWKATRNGPTAVIPTPIYADHHVFVTSGYGAGGDCFKISREGNGFKAKKAYHTADMGVHVGGVVLVDKYLYGVNERNLLCIELLTGKLKWKDNCVGKGAVTYADGHLYVRSDATPGDVALVEASPQKYVEKGRFEQPDGSGKQTWPPVVVANGKMYLRDQDALLCYELQKKKPVSELGARASK
jgi:outer membrane protein assembly factor BamB